MGIETVSRLKDNLEKVTINENSVTYIELELFNRRRHELVKRKVEEFKNLLSSKASFYGQDSDEYNVDIQKYSSIYEEELKKIVNGYEELFFCVLKIMQNAKNEQKICINNIAVLEAEKHRDFNIYHDSDDTDALQESKDDILRLQKKYFQKKINYEVLINECDARILWIIDNLEKDIETSYKTKETELVIMDESFAHRFINTIKNLFTGKKKYEEYLFKFESEDTLEIEEDVKNKVRYISYVLKGVFKQTVIAKKEIDLCEVNNEA